MHTFMHIAGKLLLHVIVFTNCVRLPNMGKELPQKLAQCRSGLLRGAVCSFVALICSYNCDHRVRKCRSQTDFLIHLGTSSKEFCVLKVEYVK